MFAEKQIKKNNIHNKTCIHNRHEFIRFIHVDNLLVNIYNSKGQPTSFTYHQDTRFAICYKEYEYQIRIIYNYKYY